ncbi:hypothetical protein [Paracraurococcus ruber]|uniref:Cyclase dehydrase n=1 Tax=Paracraurococcus ruber TaxID=77675 RepID=A0ABS1CR04_9PROT|nr:hypothetical protein [Paracraurococcus ruber]MBK1656780.1 hypothetical protein [Paracraurococcus ruber]TDG33612.1 hypothetical protein E2C05_02865 [Paracraurococcus ruber]
MRRADRTLGVARGLGWFSIGLGVVELLAPRALARGLGLRGQEGLIAGYGAREIATGIGILASRDPTPWIWGRVAGDALDLGTLATGLGRRRGGAGVALAAVAGVTLLDVLCARALSSRRERQPVRSFADRRGMPKTPGQMRGAASDFEVPKDFRIPEALRPWTSAA